MKIRFATFEWMLSTKNIALVSGPTVFIISNFIGGELAAITGILIWMAVWWISECVPLAITSLLPLILFPLTGISSTKEIAPLYMNHIIFLFAGGFLLAFAIEKWNLHKRIALGIINILGNDVRTILLGFMLAAYFLSMWISNIATTMVMMPTVLAIISNLKTKDNKTVAAIMLLATAYAASIGGTASLTGTAPNLICFNIFEQTFPESTNISFGSWFLFGLPTSLVFLMLAFLFLKRSLPKNVKLEITDSVPQKMSYEEKIVALIFSLVAILWFTRKDLIIGSFEMTGWGSMIPHGELFSDSTVAVGFAILLFVIPSKNKAGKILELDSLKKVPFDILLLFGGGFALATGINKSGLSNYLGETLLIFGDYNIIFVVIAIVTLMTFLTEFTSNTATSQLILPILASMSISTGIDSYLILIPATFAASFAFMLPIATPPNTIVFGTDYIPMKLMVRKGFVLNLIGIVVMTISILTWGKFIFGLN